MPMSKDKNRDGTIMLASLLINVPLFAWTCGLFHHFVIEPHDLMGGWFVFPWLITVIALFFCSWTFTCEAISNVWKEDRSSGDSDRS